MLRSYLGASMTDRDGVPTALPHEPTTIVWDRANTPITLALADDQTVRVCPVRVGLTSESSRLRAVSDGVPTLDDDPDDGIPRPIEPERSVTAAVVLVDLMQAFDVLVKIAHRDQIRLSTIAVERHADDVAPPTIDTTAILAMTGYERQVRRYKALVVMVFQWHAFRQWLPYGLREAQVEFHRTFDTRMATALCERLRVFAAQVAEHQPPRGVDYDVLHVE